MSKLSISRFFDRNINRKPDYSQGFIPGMWANKTPPPPKKADTYKLKDMFFSELGDNGYALISIRNAGDDNIRESYYEIHRPNYPVDGKRVIKVKNKPADIVLKKYLIGTDIIMAYVYRRDPDNRNKLKFQSKRKMRLNIRK